MKGPAEASKTDVKAVVPGLQQEIRRRMVTRYEHRLHAVLLVAHGMTCPQVARLLGDAPRTVEYWVRRFEANGPAGLHHRSRSGRPTRLNEAQWQAVQKALSNSPRKAGLDFATWDGRALQLWIAQQYGIELGIRQCQRILSKIDAKRPSKLRNDFGR